MRMQTADRDIERVAIGSERKFAIKASGKAFAILSGSLYRDKIRAIIRELSCNAYDAHVAAGYPDRPFWVHLPNTFEPFFAVRDSGIGLSPTDIETLYTTYFESTKTESNDYIGAMGLGSKSPFSYVDSFTVTSWFNGKKYYYAAFISETGEPVITLMAETDTDQPNGVEVSLPVKHSGDYSDFSRKAAIVLSQFKTPPEVVGSAEFKFQHYDDMIVGEGWRITERAFTSPHHEALAIMGNVSYPIVASAIQTLSEDAKRIFRLAIDIDFPIGTLDVTAGREDLSYDKATLKALEVRAKEIIADAPERVKNRFDACETEFEARKLFGKLYLYGSILSNLLVPSGYPPAEVIYRGKTIKSNYFDIDLSKPDMPELKEINIEIYSDYRRKYHKYTHSHNRSPVLHLDTLDNVLLMVDDLAGKGVRGRIMHHRSTKFRTNLVFIQGPKASVDVFLGMVVGFSIEYTSNLEKPPSKTRAPANHVARMTDNMFSTYQSKLNKDCWANDTVDLSEGGFYVRKSGLAVLRPDGMEEGNALRIFSLAKQLKLLPNVGKILLNPLDIVIDAPKSIYGFDAAMTKKAVATGNWVNLFDHIKTSTEALLANDTQFQHRMRFQNFLDDACRGIEFYKPILSRIARALPSDHILTMFMNDWETSGLSRDDDHRIKEMCALLNIVTLDFDDEPVMMMWHNIVRKYPLLTFFNANYSVSHPSIDIAHVIDYVQFCDLKLHKPAPLEMESN